MQEQFVEYFIDNKLIKIFLELLGKDIVKLIDDG